MQLETYKQHVHRSVPVNVAAESEWRGQVTLPRWWQATRWLLGTVLQLATQSILEVYFPDLDPMFDAPPVLPRLSWLHLATGTVAFLCCPFPCGIASFLSAILSYIDYRVCELDAWRRKRRLAMRCGGPALFLQQLVERQQMIVSQQAQLKSIIAN